MTLRACSFATTFELLEELDARHKAFVFVAIDPGTGGIVFDCNGEPVELLGLGQVAAIKAGDEAEDALDDDDDDCGGDCVGCPMLAPVKVASGALPDGDYVAKITKHEWKPIDGDARKNGERLNLTLEVVEGEHKGRVLFEGLNVNSKAPRAEGKMMSSAEYARGRFRSIVDSCGLTVCSHVSELYGIPFVVAVSSRMGGVTGEARNEIRSYRKRVYEVAPPPPVPAPPVVVKVDKRSSKMPGDVTHIVLSETVCPGDIVPDYCEVRHVGWTPSDIAGKKYEWSVPSTYRRGSGVVTLTPENRGSNVEGVVTHLVEVTPKVGEARPEFYFGDGKWKRSAVVGRPIESWEKTVTRRARRALPEETPVVPKTVEPTYISRLAPAPEVAFTLSDPKPKLIELTPENSGDIPEDVTHIVEIPYPGEGGIEPEFFMLRDKWDESGIAGDTIIEGGTFGDCRHARRARPEEIAKPVLIEVPEKERGYNFPEGVTHLVEVPVKDGDALPEFLRASTGRWIRNESRGKAAKLGNLLRRHARRAEPNELPKPPKPAPQIVKIEKRTKTVPADVTHVVVEPSVGPGDIIPPLVEIDGVWGQDGSPSGSKFVGGGPSIYRRGRAATPAEAGTLIDITTNNRGASVPSNVTHLVEVAVKAGDADPGFFKAKGSGNWLASTSSRPLTERDTEWRCARAARPDEIPAPPAPKPAPVVEMTPTVKPFRPLTSSSLPRLTFRPEIPMRSARLW